MARRFFIRHIAASLLFLAFGVTILVAEDVPLKLSVVHTPRAAGLGGAVTAVPVGIESILYNPAGISAPMPGKTRNWTFMLSADTYFQPKYLFPILAGVSGTGNAAGELLVNAKDLVTTSGVGAAGVLALAYTGSNFGAGLFSSASIFLDGKPFPLGTEGFVQLEFNVPLAFALILHEASAMRLSAGVSVQPGVTIYKELDGSDVDALVGGTQTVRDIVSDALRHPYINIPADAGMILSVQDKPYHGAQIRFAMAAKNLFGDYFVPGENLEPLPRPLSVQVATAALFPFSLLGLDFHALVSAELRGLNNMVSGGISFWDALHVGLELVVGGVVHFQCGLASGYPCIGAQLSLFWFSLGCSWQTVETGRYIGDNPVSIFRVTAMFRP